MPAKRTDPIALDGFELRASSDGESYLWGATAGGAFIVLGDVKAGRVDVQLDEALQKRQEEAAAKQAEIAPEPGTIASTDPGSAPPGAPGDEPPAAPQQPPQQ